MRVQFFLFFLKNDFRSSIKELSEMEKESCHAAYTRHAPMSTYLINIRTVSVKVDSNTICNVPEFRRFRSILHTEWTIAYHEPTYVFVSFHVKGVTQGWALYVDLTTIKAALNLHDLTSTHMHERPLAKFKLAKCHILGQHSAQEIEIFIQNLSSTIPFTIFVPLKHCGLPHHDHGVIADLLPPNKAKLSLSLSLSQ